MEHDEQLVAWLSTVDFQGDDEVEVINSLQRKLDEAELDNIEYMTNATHDQIVIRQLREADAYLAKVQKQLKDFLEVVRPLKDKAAQLSHQTSQLSVEQKNLSDLESQLASHLRSRR
mmetsp:Transcript_26779/g.48259  ORF Transcript_26779/g.48259 Transcript_26779/m.48259 type:complete len:117 (+) Transcript_26779:885-1235(+)